MKLDALEHPKLFQLIERLNVKRTTAIGHLELLWAFTAKHAPQGDIGKWPDGAIARACDWDGGAEVFILALIDAGFVDADDEHRLIIHDWRDHAQGWVRAKLKKLQLDFVGTSEGTSERSSEGTSDGSDDDTSEPSSRARVPSLAKPSQAKSKKPPTPLQGANGARAPQERKPRSVTDASLGAWNRAIVLIDAVRSDRSKTWADADQQLEVAAVQAIRSAGGHKLIADRTQFTQANLKKLFRDAYESILENGKEAEGRNGHDHDEKPPQSPINGLVSEAAKGMQ